MLGSETAGKATAGMKLRAQMPVAEKYAYFDHAAVSPLPRSSSAAMKQYAQEAAEHGDALWLGWAAKVEELRGLAAKLIGASSEEIALVNNTTQGINLVASGIDWREGDNIVVPDNEFPSNVLAWQCLERWGVEIRPVPVPADGAVTAALLQPYVDGRTRLVTASWVGFASGFRIDVGPLVELAHQRGAMFFLDAIQGLGAFPLDVRASQIDFLCADGHKWMLGPEGAAIFYVSKRRLSDLIPSGLGWNSLASGAFDNQWSDSFEENLKPNAARYEGGTTNMAGMHGFRASLETLIECGVNASESSVAESILHNVDLLSEGIRKAGFHLLAPDEEENRSGILGLCLQDPQQPQTKLLMDARKYLLARDIVTSVRANRLRVATHAYNNEEDVTRIIETLVEFRDRS